MENKHIKINKITFSNFGFFYGDIEFEFNNENVLIYGENGSGKSTIAKALELLIHNRVSTSNGKSDSEIKRIKQKEDIKNSFKNSKNIFADKDNECFINYCFSDGGTTSKSLGIFTHSVADGECEGSRNERMVLGSDLCKGCLQTFTR